MSFAGCIPAVTGAGGPTRRGVVDRLVAGGVAGLAMADISSHRLFDAEAALPADQQARLTGMAMNPRMADPAEVADAICYFLPEDARFFTGEMLSVSGGIRPHL